MREVILFILDGYPTEKTNHCVFVKNLIYQMADQGAECVVIAPRIRTVNNEQKGFPYYTSEITDNQSRIRIYRPWYMHLSSNRFLMKKSMDNHYKAVLKTIIKENIKPDYVYGHFIYQCGLTAARVGSRLNIPSYCAVGENSRRLEEGSEPYETGKKYANWVEILNTLTGIISVSQYNLDLLLQNGFIDKHLKALVSPNGVDHERFFVIDKIKAREKKNLPKDVFIIAFTGAFSERKGFYRLCEALNSLDDVYSVFMGSGKDSPNCRNVLYNGSVPNNELVHYLNVADVFVLPTNGEGCSNAIIEALACGLPVISSNLPFNDGILNEKNSLRIDTESTIEIAKAIKSMKENPELCKRLSAGAVQTAEKLSNKTRAHEILRFIGVNND